MAITPEEFQDDPSISKHPIVDEPNYGVEKDESNGELDQGEDNADYDEDEEDEDEEEEDEEVVNQGSLPQSERARMENLFRRLSTERVTLRVHDVLIKGNTKTKDSVIEAELETLRDVKSLQELLQAASIVNARLNELSIFDSVNIMLDAGPPELPGTANVVIEVSETKNPLTGEIGMYTKPGARSWSVEGSLKLKNLVGYADIWDSSLAYGWDQTTEVSFGVSLPRIGRWISPVFARAFLLSQDWLKFSSYKERSLGLSLGLLSTNNHDLVYNLMWRTLTDPTQMASSSVRRQLGHNLLSSLKYTFKIDRRNSPLRPTHGYCFASTTQLAGISPDSRSLRFLRQEIDLRFALPLGLFRSALNFGISGGVIFPWGKGFLSSPSSLPDRFFMGGNSSPVCSLGGPSSLLGFKTRGLGPTELRRQSRVKSDAVVDSESSEERDVLGGDLAVTAFADLSFDLPLKVLRDAGIHGHMFACAGNLVKLTENEFRSFSFEKFRRSFRTSAGFGVIVPTKLFRMEVNYCHVLRQLEHDQGKTGVQFSFSSPL